MKYINIFIGSSIVEMEMERSKLMQFIQSLNNKYVERGVFLRGYICEETSSAMTLGGSQKRHNDFIEYDADAALFLFFHKAGEFTMEELKLARETFLRQGKPSVFVFFKAVDAAPDVSEEIQKCVGLVAGEYGHYYKVFDNVDTVKLELLQFLADALPGSGELLVRDNTVWMNGEAVEGISSGNIFSYQNNPDLRRLKDKAASLERLMKGCSARGDKNGALRLSVQLEQVREDYHELEKAILDTLTFFHRQCRKGAKADPLLQEALTQLELGEIEAAKALIPQEELDRMAENARKRRAIAEEQLRSEELKLLEYSRARIKILLADVTNPERFQEVTTAYENALDTAKLQQDYAFIFEYAQFLRQQNRYPDAIRVGERLRYLYDEPDTKDRVRPEDRAELLNLLGLLYMETTDFTKAKADFTEALEIRRSCRAAAPSAENDFLVAKSCDCLAGLYRKDGKNDQSEALFLEALEILRKLVRESSREQYEPEVAEVCNNLAYLYMMNMGRPEDAERLLNESLEIRRRFAKEVDRDKYEPTVAAVCTTLAGLYHYGGKQEEADKYFREALEIVRRFAEEINPEAYEPLLAKACFNRASNLAMLHRESKNNEVEALLLEALSSFRRLSEEVSQEAYAYPIAAACQRLGEYYVDLRQMDKAEKPLFEALAITRRLAEEVSQAYSWEMANSCNAVGNMYYNSMRLDEALRYYQQALAIYRRLAEEISREQHEQEVAMGLYSIGNCYYKKDLDGGEWKPYYAEAEEITLRYKDHNSLCAFIYDELAKLGVLGCKP